MHLDWIKNPYLLYASSQGLLHNVAERCAADMPFYPGQYINHTLCELNNPAGHFDLTVEFENAVVICWLSVGGDFYISNFREKLQAYVIDCRE